MTQDGPTQGTIPTRRCWSCGSDSPAHYNFCSRCGAPLATPPPYRPAKPVTVRDIGRLMGAYSTIPLLILMAVNVIMTIWAIGLVYPHMDKNINLFVVTPWLVTFAELTGWGFLLYYIFLAAAIAASFVWMLRKSARPLKDELTSKPVKEHSPLFTIGTMFMAVLAFNVIFYALVASSGTSPTSPDYYSPDLWAIVYGFANASVWEEVVTRILLLGVPLLLIDALRRSVSVRARERKLHQYILGGGLEIGKVEAGLLLFSSAMFGIAHVWSWDLWKIVPAFAAGLAFGYLFLKLGIYASILLHFAFDFLSIPLLVWPGLALEMGLGLLSLLWVAVGVAFLAYYLAKGFGWITGRRIWPDVPFRTKPVPYAPPPYWNQGVYPPQPPQQGQPPVQHQYQPAQYPPVPAPVQHRQPPADPGAFGYRCQHCGNMEAHYKDGQLVCTKCGRS